MTRYYPHSVKCYVDIGDGTDNHIDYCICYQPPKSLIIIKYKTSCAIYDFNAFMKADYSKPLNAKRFATTDEAYEKMMKLIGKMIKKDIRGRYYNNSLGPYQFEPTISDEILDNLRLKIHKNLKIIRKALTSDIIIK